MKTIFQRVTANLGKDSKGRIIVPDAVAQEGYSLAQDFIDADRKMERANNKAVDLRLSKLKRDRKLAAEADRKYDEAVKEFQEVRKKVDEFEKKHGIDIIGAWQAHTGQYWPYYKVDSGGSREVLHVKQSKAE